ncbi:hypothetical protein FRACA_50064 [Frankia canadensis]|uniref:Uncharacterized protein n=1 Tax=Frankia canadensis TaxID=1836972 RepID=A0A2I2KYE6_9ACTN|nr:hypothetical protein FRACA_50064 [Frankia canadensis]SOU57966.1 hypothetical protein FRACA_50064 [Frankia canadensis]
MSAEHGFPGRTRRVSTFVRHSVDQVACQRKVLLVHLHMNLLLGMAAARRDRAVVSASRAPHPNADRARRAPSRRRRCFALPTARSGASPLSWATRPERSG